MTKTYQSIRYSELHLTILVTRKGSKTPEKAVIDFIGGSTYPRKQNGTYTTDDKEIQAQLEKNNAFNLGYRLLFKDGNPVYKEPEDQSLEDKLKAANKLNTLLTQQLQDLDRDEVDNDTEDVIDGLRQAISDQQEIIDTLEKENAELKLALETAGAMKPVEEKEDKELIKAEGIVNMQAARQYLIKTHGQDIKTMKNGKQVLIIAEKLGVVFPDWHPKS